MNLRSSITQSILVASALSFFACSSSSAENQANSADSGAPTTIADAGTAPLYVGLVTGTLTATNDQDAKTQHDQIVNAYASSAKAAGELGHAPLFNKDPSGPDGGAGPLLFLGLDRWSSADAASTFYASDAAQKGFAQLFKVTPTAEVLSVRDGWTSWGSTSDVTNDPNVFAITIVGHFQGSVAQGQATHNQLVANVPAPGPVGQGNIAHLPLINQADPTTLTIVEVWNNEANQVHLYSDPSFQMALGGFWAGQPTITRWRSTDLSQW